MQIRRISVLALVLLGLMAFAGTSLAKRGDDSARASKNDLLEATLDGVEVMVEYGKPKVRGRIVWGGLVPYDKVWRTGADEATTITFSADVTIEGKTLGKGTYALFTIPGEKTWTVIFNSQAEQWGAFGYDAAKDVLRVEVTPTPTPTPASAEDTDELSFAVEKDRVVLSWAKLTVAFGVASDG